MGATPRLNSFQNNNFKTKKAMDKIKLMMDKANPEKMAKRIGIFEWLHQ